VTLAELLPANLFAALLVFLRVGGALMLLPGFGEAYVPQRYRLLLALLVSALLAPVLAPILPPMPQDVPRLAAMVGGELVVGIFIGTLARIVMAALETAGMVISLQLGLSAAVMFNPLAAQQGAITSALMGVLGVLLLFLTDLHHLMLRAIAESYAVFGAGAMPAAGDLSDAMARAVAQSFRLAIELSAPFIVLGTVFFVAMGLVARLVPQVQILFVTQPVQILGGLLVFALALVAGMRWFLDAFVQALAFLVSG
jgi:flagellar biosynthetic protein FliR